MSDRTQDLKNLRAVATACKGYVDKSIDNLKWELGTYDLGIESDNSVARVKTLHANTIKSMVDYIGGKTCKYNQLMQNGNFESTNNWEARDSSFNVSNNIASILATSQNGRLFQAINVIANHKYFYIANLKLTTANTDVKIDVSSDFSVYTQSTTNWQQLTMIFTRVSSTLDYLRVVDTRSSGWDTINVDYIECIDLTDKFGAGNEPSDVSTAIQLLKANGYKLDGTDTYSTGLLKHAITTSVNFLPINVWDEEREVGRYNDTTGEKEAGYSNTIRSKNFINVIPNTQYKNFVKNTTDLVMYIFYYDKNKNFISKENKYCNANTTPFTTPSNCWYITFYLQASYGTTYKNDICINISNASYNGNYYPYVAPVTKAIPSEVLADVRYGLGFDNTTYNHLDSDGHLRGSRNLTDLTSISWSLRGSGTNKSVYSASLNEAYTSNGSNPLKWLIDIYAYNGASSYADIYNAGIDNANLGIYSFDTTGNTTTIYAVVPINTTPSGILEYDYATAFDQDYSQYFTPNWSKVDLDKLYATCEMVVADPIDMPNSISNLFEEVKA